MSAYLQVKEFHEAFGAPIAQSPTLEVSDEVKELRVALIEEEFTELKEALEDNDLVEVADALADLAYVIYGAALTFGIPLDEIVKEVHRSNMTKLGSDGLPVYRADGKIIKGPNYEEPQIKPLLEEL